MSRDKSALHRAAASNDRVERLLSEIDTLSYYELRSLKNKLTDNNSYPIPTQNIAELSNSKTIDPKTVSKLSQREIDVLTLVATGYSRKEIAAALNITSNTAAKHISSIYRKLNICSIAEATRIALENGVITSYSSQR